MVILDTFKYKDKTAIYCRVDEPITATSIKKAEIDGKVYDVIKAYATHSMAGNKAIVLLLDTNAPLPIQEAVTIS